MAEAGAEVEEAGAGLEAREDGGEVERVVGEAEGEEPEFADAGPGEDAPGFVALERGLGGDVIGVGCWDLGGEGAYYSVNVGLDVFGGDVAVIFEDGAGVGGEFGA